MKFPRINSLKTPEAFRSHTHSLGIDLPLDDVVETGPDAPLAASLTVAGRTIGNRFCILPMEGWDGTTEGRPTDLTRRRWTHFGLSGAKLIWGGEAIAVRHDGRANPNQLLIDDSTLTDIEALRQLLVATHEEHFDTSGDLLVGLQLTHSGRFSRPNDKTLLEPRIAYRHPVLDDRTNVEDDSHVLSDDDLRRLIDDFIAAAGLAAKAGFDFVDIKHCHGYLGHELLSGYDRPGAFGGSFENRTRFLREIVSGIQSIAPALQVGVRLSAFDYVPFTTSESGPGEPAANGPYRNAFGGDGTGLGIDLTEPSLFLDLLQQLGVELLCTTAGSPYYNPHIQRPAAFPPSDGYTPPEDPLCGVARQIAATAELKKAHPRLTIIGSSYTYLQEWLPNVAQHVLRTGGADSIGLGRMVLSYPELPADILAGRPYARKKVCRTFSDCTTAPRNGMVSGCYPLDDFYKSRPERQQLLDLKAEAKS